MATSTYTSYMLAQAGAKATGISPMQISEMIRQGLIRSDEEVAAFDIVAGTKGGSSRRTVMYTHEETDIGRVRTQMAVDGEAVMKSSYDKGYHDGYEDAREDFE